MMSIARQHPAGAVDMQRRQSRIDYPTSSLDPSAEPEPFPHLRQAIEGRSAILISRRFSTVQMADHFYVTDQGRIAESGTHWHQLVRNGPSTRLQRAEPLRTR